MALKEIMVVPANVQMQAFEAFEKPSMTGPGINDEYNVECPHCP